MLFDECGKVIASDTKEYNLYQPQNGYAEQDPSDWVNAMAETVRSVILKSGISSDKIVGVGISGQMHGLVMLDKDGKVLRNSIIWCDQRTTAEVELMNKIVGKDKLIEITANPALTGWTAAKILWVRNNEPEIYDKCRHILLPKDYLRYILTGEFASEVSDASGMQLLNVGKRQWSKEICTLDEYSLMNKEAENVPIGSNRLLYLPYLMGERTPYLDPDARGVFIGLSAIHTKRDMLRAVMEGVSYSLRDCIEVFKEMKINISDMAICGGGGKSALWRSMLSDLYKCPVKTTKSEEGPALGAAILAMVGAGIYSSVEEACEMIVKDDKIQDPVSANSKEYEKYYKLYKKIYPSLKDNFAELARL